MSCVLTKVNFPRWITQVISSTNGLRLYATKSHLRAVTKQVIEVLIRSDKIVIFSKSGCVNSDIAKSIFNDMNQKYTAVELDRREDGPFIQTHLAMTTGSALMPRIFIIGKCIGGTTELIQLQQNGQLLRLINQDA